jgi:ferric-dicitrate binding protein FerR (iron transport regulator)
MVYRFSGGAAAIILLLVVFIYFYRGGPATQAGSFHEMVAETKPGQSRTLVLGDGTRVWLGPASRLEYPDKFTGKERTVELAGEAFFTVAENADKPFIVRTGSLNTRILGTSFDIVAYRDRSYSTVTVATGKVSVAIGDKSKKGSSPMEVLPNQRVTFNEGGYQLVKEDFPDAAMVLRDRRNGHLKYKGVPLSTVVEDLSVEYGATIKINPGMGKRAYYGDLDLHEGLEVSLKVLCLTFNADLTKDGNVYIINGKGS